MRKAFIQCKTRYQAKKQAPWACCTVKCDGGFMCFESAADCFTWKSQR